MSSAWKSPTLLAAWQSFALPYTMETVTEKIATLYERLGCEEGIATATGMAANFLGLVSHLRAGDHILASRSLFSSSHQIITQIPFLPKPLVSA